VALERDRCIVLLLTTTVCEIARCVDARVTHEDSLIPPTAHPADRESNALLPASPIVNASGPQQVTDAPSSSNSCCSTQLAWDESLDDSSSAALDDEATGENCSIVVALRKYSCMQTDGRTTD